MENNPMGEIKSTLDLVMKKTEHLSLSAEERQEQNNIEIKKRIKGLLQKYQDQTLSKDELDTEFAKLKKEFSFSDDTPVVNSILKELDLNKENFKLLALLKKYCGKDAAAIESVLNEYQDEINSAASYRMVQLREDLAKRNSISGSAVVPNLQADDTWLAEAGDIRSKFEQKLEEEKVRISQ
jgi:hypothetical protein